MAFKMKYKGFPMTDDPPGTENEVMSTIHDMINSGADPREIYNFAKHSGDGKSNYNFNMENASVEVDGPNGRRKLNKDNETLGLYRENASPNSIPEDWYDKGVTRTDKKKKKVK